MKAYVERYDPMANGGSCLQNPQHSEDLTLEAFSN